MAFRANRFAFNGVGWTGVRPTPHGLDALIHFGQSLEFRLNETQSQPQFLDQTNRPAATKYQASPRKASLGWGM